MVLVKRKKAETILLIFLSCLLLTALNLLPRSQEGAGRKDSPRIVNIINFVRQCEPRDARITEDVLYQTVVEQVKIIDRYQFKAAFLLQYDALIDPRYQELMKKLPADRFEIGAWWEIPQPLVEKSGLKWRGRYPWDWQADVGFSTGYTPEEREKLIDTYMEDFRKIFGYYPGAVGSWFIDEHSLRYMYEKYGIVASCNCKDQAGTDGYTLWGGYWSGGYYPSKLNAYMPAQSPDHQIPVPVFRMLGSDPIHQYDLGLGTGEQPVISLEPVYEKGGGNESWCRWYFDWFVRAPAVNYAYVQVGQENSFTWERMARGYKIQMKILDELVRKKKIVLQTLSETGRWFKENYRVTPPAAVVVLRDHSEKNLKTVWFNSRFYRANLLWEDNKLRFRDIHIFDEKMASDYLDRPGTSTRCFFFTLPFVDGFFWSSKNFVAGLRFKNRNGSEIEGEDPAVEEKPGSELLVHWPAGRPRGEFVIRFRENSLQISGSGRLGDDWYLELKVAPEADLPFIKIEPASLLASFRNQSYQVKLAKGRFLTGEDRTLRILPDGKEIILDLSSGRK